MTWLESQPQWMQDILCPETIYYPTYSDDTILGVVLPQEGLTSLEVPVLAYDMEKIVAELVDDDLSDEDAREYLDFNTVGAWLGPHTPYHIWTDKWAAEDEWCVALDQEKPPDDFLGIGERCSCTSALFLPEHSPARTQPRKVHSLYTMLTGQAPKQRELLLVEDAEYELGFVRTQAPQPDLSAEAQ